MQLNVFKNACLRQSNVSTRPTLIISSYYLLSRLNSCSKPPPKGNYLGFWLSQLELRKQAFAPSQYS